MFLVLQKVSGVLPSTAAANQNSVVLAATASDRDGYYVGQVQHRDSGLELSVFCVIPN